MTAPDTAPEYGAVAVTVPAWACKCARCGHEWITPCGRRDCERARSAHVKDCTPPKRCSECKAHHWERPRLYVMGEGTSSASARRKRLVRAARRGVCATCGRKIKRGTTSAEGLCSKCST